MRKLMLLTLLCSANLCAFGQAHNKYEVATITGVKAHQDSKSQSASYDVSVQVGDTTYVVLYTPPLGIESVKYAGGSELLVHVGDKKITYNDILGESHEVPILSQTTAAKLK